MWQSSLRYPNMFWHLAGETACPTLPHPTSPHEVQTQHTFSHQNSQTPEGGKNAASPPRENVKFLATALRAYHADTILKRTCPVSCTWSPRRSETWKTSPSAPCAF